MSKILNILTDPNPILRKESTPLDAEKLKESELQEFCRDLILTMKEKDGVGLAAPQVGKNIRIIVVTVDNKPVCLINPQITKRSWARAQDEEGCLSVPGKYGQVERNKKVNCSYLTPGGKKKQIRAQDLSARIIQHEIDHLDGILFIDKAKSLRFPGSGS